ncbi:MAG: hypothetical protein ACOCQT_04330 [Desulfovermiculus sp.]
MQNWGAGTKPAKHQTMTTSQADQHEPPDHAAEAFIVHTQDIYYLAILYTDEKWRTYGNGYARFANGQKMTFRLDGNNDPHVREKCIQASRQIAHAYQGTLRQGVMDSSGRFWPEGGENTPDNLM